jgi:RNA polymerase sigma-70 factor (ECF subfamily)
MVDLPGSPAELFDQEFPRIYNYVRYRCGDADLADDLTAEVFERALTRFESYNPELGPFHAWILAIAHNLVCNHFRAERLRHFLPWEWFADRAAPGPIPEEQVIREERQHALHAALERLSDRERELVALKFSGGLTNTEIACLMGLSVSNVGVILCRALRRLGRELEQGEPVHREAVDV